jgi:outer membrane protein TolC
VGTNYELDFWGRIRNLVAAANAQAQGSAADLQTEKLSLQSKVASIFFQLRGIDKQIAVLNNAVNAYSRALELINNRYEVGVASGIDLSRAQSQLHSAKSEVVELIIQRSVYEHAIAVLIGETPQTFIIKPLNLDKYQNQDQNAVLNYLINSSKQVYNANEMSQLENARVDLAPSNSKILPNIVDPAVISLSKVPEIPIVLPSQLLERRPDVASAERKMAAANKRIGVAKAGFYPSFYFGAYAGYQNTGGPAWLSEPNSVWSIGPQASLNLFDGGLREAQLAQSKSALEQASAEYRLTVLTAYQQVEDALTQLKQYKTEINDRKSAAGAALRAMQLATSRYKEGAVNFLEVVTAQTSALQAQRSLIALDTTRLVTSVELIKALGGGWNKDSLKIRMN